jgi:hypothetical protein
MYPRPEADKDDETPIPSEAYSCPSVNPESATLKVPPMLTESPLVMVDEAIRDPLVEIEPPK